MNIALADEAARALLDAVPHGSQVVLFGSYARGTARPDSDFDFLVVEPEVTDCFKETFRLRKAVEAVFGDRVQTVDIVVTNWERFRSARNTPNTLAFEAAREGRVYG